MIKRILIIGAVLSLLSTHALAEDSWDYRLTPYIWFAGIEGKVTTLPGAPSVPIDISPSQAVEDTQAGVMLVFDAKKGRHGVYADLLYTDVQSDDELIPPPIGLNLKSTSKTTLFTLAYQHEVYEQDGAVLDLLVGMRYWIIDSELVFGGGSGVLAGQRIKNDESWVDPALGLKGRMPLGESAFYLEGGVGIGGFSIGSDLFYDINGAVGYQWNEAIGTAVGYRLFDVDYDDGFEYDVRQQGWQVGLTWAF